MATVVFANKGTSGISRSILRDVTLGKPYEVVRKLSEGDETQGDAVTEPGFEFIDDAGDLVSVKFSSPTSFTFKE